MVIGLVRKEKGDCEGGVGGWDIRKEVGLR
jgi:hypothetical protein